MKIRGLCKLPDGKDWLWGDLGLALVGRTKVNQSLIQFSVSLQSSFLLMGGDVFPLASGQTKRREYSTTHQQKIGLKIY